MKLLSSILGGRQFLFTGGRYGKYVEGKMCPKCGVRRIRIERFCCKPCYDKYYKQP